MDDIYNMNLHQQFQPDSTGHAPFIVTRVPGGWIYTFYNQTYNAESERMSSVFVPYS